jgi:chromosome segregation ATPase
MPSEDRISILQIKQDDLARNMGAEKARLATLDKEVDKSREQILSLREQRKKFKLYGAYGGGVDATKHCHQNVQREIKLLENRLNKTLNRHSDIMNQNRKLKEEINYKRQKRLIFDDIYKKLKSQLEQKQLEMQAVMGLSNEANEEREEAIGAEDDLKQLAGEEEEQFEIEYNELGHYIDQQRQARDSEAKSKEVVVTEEGEGVRGSMSVEEEESLKARLDHINRDLNNADNKRGATEDKIRSYEEAFEKLQQATGIRDINELVATFINNEDETFSLFSYIQSINQEVDQTEEKTARLKADMKKYQEDQGESQVQRKQALDNLKEKLARVQKKQEDYFKGFEESKSTIELIAKTVQSIFFKIGCDQMQGIRDSMSTKGGKGGGKSGGHGDSSMSLEVSMLSGQDITDSNIMQYLGIIEQKAVEVCGEYARQSKSTELATSIGPQTPMQPNPVLQVSIPAYDEFEDDEEAEQQQQEPQRLLSLEEMRTMAAVDVQKRKEKGKGGR